MDINSPELGFKVDTSDLEKATQSLANVSKAAGEAASSADKVSQSMKQSFDRIAGSSGSQNIFAGMMSDLSKVNSTIKETDNVSKMLGQSFNSYASGAKEAADGVDKLAKAHGGLDAQAQAAFHSIRSFGEQLFYGANITQAAAGQMGHLSFAMTGEGGIVGAFSRAAGTVSNFINPLTIALGPVAALAAGALYLGHSWQVASNEVSLALTGIGARTGTTAADIEKFAKDNSSALGLTVSEAKAAALEFTRTGEVAVANMRGVGDAIKGYSLLTGTDATEATKKFTAALTGDTFKAVEALNQAYGALNGEELELIRTLSNHGEKEKALQVFIDATTAANRKAEEQVSSLARAWGLLKDAMSRLTTAAPQAPVQERLAAAQKQLDIAQSASPGVFAGGTGITAQALDDLKKKVEELKEELRSTDAEPLISEFNKVSSAAQNAVHAILPQIDAIDKLKAKLEDLQLAKENDMAPEGADGAIAVYKYQLQLLNDQKDALIQHAEIVNQLVTEWGGVSAQTATTLTNQQQQLYIAQQLTAADQMKAQAEAYYSQLVLNGTKAEEARLLANGQLAISQAKATAEVERQTEKIKDQIALINARRTGTEAEVASSIAYKNAIASGASDQAAAANAAATLAQYQAQAAASAGQMAANVASAIPYYNQIVGSLTIIGSSHMNAPGMTYQDPGPQLDYLSSPSDSTAAHEGNSVLTPLGQLLADTQSQMNAAIASGNYASALGLNGQLGYLATFAGANLSPGAGGTLSHGDIQKYTKAIADAQINPETGSPYGDTSATQAIASLYANKNLSTGTIGQAIDLQKQINTLQQQPETLARDIQLEKLRQALEELTNSTKSNTTATNNNTDALSPYYTQDPRTSHIGFRSQGMATGGEFTVPGGYSANDNMLGMIPLASGEVVSVRRPGQETAGSTSNQTIRIVQNFMIAPGTNRDEFGRTAYQAGRMLAKQISSAGK